MQMKRNNFKKGNDHYIYAFLLVNWQNYRELQNTSNYHFVCHFSVVITCAEVLLLFKIFSVICS